METNNNAINSCLMWAVNFETPVSLGCLFDSDDLKDTGIEVDSHITLLYAQGKTISHAGLLDELKEILGAEDYEWILGLVKSDEKFETLDLFELGSFENDSDYLVLKLKKSNPVFKALSLINKGLRIRYGVSSDFTDYTPHLTLAELQPGTVRKYLGSETIKRVLEDSTCEYEDLFISYGTSNEPEDRKQRYLTSEKCIERYFRLERLRKELVEL